MQRGYSKYVELLGIKRWFPVFRLPNATNRVYLDEQEDEILSNIHKSDIKTESLYFNPEPIEVVTSQEVVVKRASPATQDQKLNEQTSEQPRPEIYPPFKLNIFKAGSIVFVDSLGADYDIQAELLLKKFYSNISLAVGTISNPEVDSFVWPLSSHPYAPRDKITAKKTLFHKIEQIDFERACRTIVLCGNHSQALLADNISLAGKYRLVKADRLSTMLHSSSRKKELWLEINHG